MSHTNIVFLRHCSANTMKKRFDLSPAAWQECMQQKLNSVPSFYFVIMKSVTVCKRLLRIDQTIQINLDRAFHPINTKPIVRFNKECEYDPCSFGKFQMRSFWQLLATSATRNAPCSDHSSYTSALASQPVCTPCQISPT